MSAQVAVAALCVKIPVLLAALAVAAAVAALLILKIQLSFCYFNNVHYDDFIHVKVNTHQS